MGRLIITINSAYSKMSKKEKEIADYILSQERSANPMTITELSKATGASEATIVRFAKRLGCDGYQEFKLLLAKEERHIANKSLGENDSMVQIYSKVAEDVFASLLKTRDFISESDLQKAYRLISEAKTIFFMGVGNSHSVCIDAYHKLLRLGLNVQVISDSHFMLISAAKATKDDLFIVVSHSGRTKDVVETASLAKDCEAKVLAITSDYKSPLSKKADVTLATSSEEVNYRLLGLTSRYAQLALFDTLYSYIVLHNGHSQEVVERIEQCVLSKRIPTKKKEK